MEEYTVTQRETERFLINLLPFGGNIGQNFALLILGDKLIKNFFLYRPGCQSGVVMRINVRGLAVENNAQRIGRNLFFSGGRGTRRGR
ncbi:hypothetical protein SDC9_176453 [bioreactor metagenome]|uniref:Uncharacterized protein n=1 Tax=bioreactor metagenome TaxID=1076179 RepID=A0A645GQP7_9ZZZZ